MFSFKKLFKTQLNFTKNTKEETSESINTLNHIEQEDIYSFLEDEKETLQKTKYYDPEEDRVLSFDDCQKAVITSTIIETNTNPEIIKKEAPHTPDSIVEPSNDDILTFNKPIVDNFLEIENNNNYDEQEALHTPDNIVEPSNDDILTFKKPIIGNNFEDNNAIYEFYDEYDFEKYNNENRHSEFEVEIEGTLSSEDYFLGKTQIFINENSIDNSYFNIVYFFFTNLQSSITYETLLTLIDNEYSPEEMKCIYDIRSAFNNNTEILANNYNSYTLSWLKASIIMDKSGFIIDYEEADIFFSKLFEQWNAYYRKDFKYFNNFVDNYIGYQSSGYNYIQNNKTFRSFYELLQNDSQYLIDGLEPYEYIKYPNEFVSHKGCKNDLYDSGALFQDYIKTKNNSYIILNHKSQEEETVGINNDEDKKIRKQSKQFLKKLKESKYNFGD